MCRKFAVVNELLYIDYMSTLLYTEFKYWTENKERLGVKYPLEKAEEMARKILDAGLLPDGSSIIEKFRKIITQIGNALGYVTV